MEQAIPSVSPGSLGTTGGPLSIAPVPYIVFCSHPGLSLPAAAVLWCVLLLTLARSRFPCFSLYHGQQPVGRRLVWKWAFSHLGALNRPLSVFASTSVSASHAWHDNISRAHRQYCIGLHAARTMPARVWFKRILSLYTLQTGRV